MSHELNSVDNIFPPAIPQVSMDIGLGDVTEAIDFDYHAFYQLANSNGITDEEIERLKIDFTNNGSVSVHGRYKHWPRTIMVNCSDPERRRRSVFRTLSTSALGLKPDMPLEEYTPEDGMDAVARHETGHWVNDLGARTGEWQRTASIAVAFITGIVAVAGSVVVPILTKDATTIPIAPVAGLFSWVMYGSFLQSKYGFDRSRRPHETPAYIFERDTREYRLVTFLPKQ